MSDLSDFENYTANSEKHAAFTKSLQPKLAINEIPCAVTVAREIERNADAANKQEAYRFKSNTTLAIIAILVAVVLSAPSIYKFYISFELPSTKIEALESPPIKSEPIKPPL